MCSICKLQAKFLISCECGEVFCLECGLDNGKYNSKNILFEDCVKCILPPSSIENAYDLLTPLKNNYPEGWKVFFKDNMEFVKSAQTFLKKSSKNCKTLRVFPPPDQVFEAFRLTSPKNIKVVIIGQDPYHGEGQAHGLSFSVKNGKAPPSLKNIYKELESDGFTVADKNKGDLTNWAKQGVFLYNACLTVEEATPLGHNKAKVWSLFSDQVVRYINYNCQNVVFILWGAEAQKFKKLITASKHLILESSHPSPFSVEKGFYGSRPFSKANEYLKDNGKKIVKWDL